MPEGLASPAEGYMHFNTISCLETSIRFRASSISTAVEYGNVVYVYGFCDGKAIHDVEEYQRSSPNGRITNRKKFTRVYQISRDTSTLTDVQLQLSVS